MTAYISGYSFVCVLCTLWK